VGRTRVFFNVNRVIFECLTRNHYTFTASTGFSNVNDCGSLGRR